MAKKELTTAQKYADEFEELTKLIITYLFSDIQYDIKSTKLKKDGGVDIILQVFDNNKEYKIFIESKLRSVNLNLRDISANVIIAFNNGAMSMIAVTNNNYTKQLEKELSFFSLDNIFNIKILIGKQIKELLNITNSEKKFSSELIDILEDKHSYINNLEILKINLENLPLYKQFIEFSFNNNIDRELNPFPKSWKKIQNKISSLIDLNCSLLVSGLINNGKTTFIKNILKTKSCKIIDIDCFICKTTKQMFLYLLMSVWNINHQTILESFEDSTIDNIVESLPLNDKKEFKNILLYLFNKHDNVPLLIINNYITSYVFKSISLFNRNINFVFHIQNIQDATQEILNNVEYIMRMALQENISYIIDFDEDIENSCSINKYIPKFMLNCMKTIKIPLLKHEEASEYLYSLDTHISHKFIQDIVNQHTPIMSNLHNSYRFIKKHYNTLESSHIHLKDEISIIEPIDIIICEQDSIFKQVMIVLYLCQKIVPIEIYSALHLDNNALDQLISYHYVDIKYDCLCAENTLSDELLSSYVSRFPMELQIYAKEIEKCISDNSAFITQKISILGYLKKYEQALEIINKYYLHLKKTKQYSLCLDYIKISINYCEIINDQNVLDYYLCEYIEIIIMTKNIYSLDSNDYFSKIIYLKKIGKCSESLNIRFEYIKAMRFYKKRKHSDALNILEPYYLNFKVTKRLNEEWEGLLLTRYALCIKEIFGNLEALKVFKYIFDEKPDNYYIFNGYHSHVPCTLFYDKPLEAKEHYLKMEKKYLENQDKHAIPFHLYADLAMTDLLSHEFNDCQLSCDKSICLSSSYNVYDELGRSYNILGCVHLCKGEYQRAYELFNDSKYMLSLSQYKSFAWRTKLNLIYTRILLNHDKAEIISEFNNCYCEIQSLYSEKISNLTKNLKEFYRSREYYALLLIKLISQKLNIKKTIKKDFHLSENINTRLNNDRRAIEKNKITVSLEQCSYLYKDILFTVG